MKGSSVRFVLEFHAAGKHGETRLVAKLRNRGSSCALGDALDFVISELVKQRNEFLPR